MAILVGAALAALLLAPTAGAVEPGWHSEQPVAAGIGVPAPFGEVGDIEFVAPNRGVLITAGNEGMPAGVYAYDGTGWHLYSTVCGGHEGRIAWAGPDEFWTVSDYATRQEGQANARESYGRTLCHFAGGKVVASYAEPLGSPEGYRRMSAAACNGPSDCWFAGAPLEGSPNTGAFHLHWDGASLTALPSLTQPQPQVEEPPGSITGLSFFDGAFYESATEAPFLRQILAGQPNPFQPLTLPAGAEGPFEMATDGYQLWAVGDQGTSALRSVGAGLEEISLKSTLGPVRGVAPEPGGETAWVAGGEAKGGPARVTEISADGSVGPPVILPEPAEELDPKGVAKRIVCPAAGQCWMVTEEGWLFHLGGSLPRDEDPAMHALITYRPPDESTRSFVASGVPVDNSGEVETVKSREGEVLRERFPTSRKPKALAYKIKQRLIHKTILELSFILRARAHVQLIAKRHHKVVAMTPKLTLGKGPHRLRLRLNLHRFPTGLDFEVHPAGKSK